MARELARRGGSAKVTGNQEEKECGTDSSDDRGSANSRRDKGGKGVDSSIQGGDCETERQR